MMQTDGFCEGGAKHFLTKQTRLNQLLQENAGESRVSRTGDIGA
jgi:hypothetical protein